MKTHAQDKPLTHHEHFMRLALFEAEKGRFSTSPNPMVGCVLVKNNEIIAEAYHHKAGLPHAEINALNAAGIHAKDADLYVNLEPCCHHGRTPPCTEAIIAAGVKKVIIACTDPNPLVAGQGIQALQQAGISVITDVCEEEALKLNKVFFHYIKTKRPFVYAKWAMSLDGKTITHANDDKKISNNASHEHSHILRQEVDAILIGGKTAIEDNPTLTPYLVAATQSKKLTRLVLASQSLPLHLNIFKHHEQANTIVIASDKSDKNYLAELNKINIETIILPSNTNHQIDLMDLLKELGQREITSLLVEGGMTLLTAFLQQKLVNEIQVYLAPVIIANANKKMKLEPFYLKSIDNDLLITTKFLVE